MSVLFGPVPSRRFGRSLGIDLFDRKTCTFDCVYCEVGSNPERTSTVRTTVSVPGILGELTTFLADHHQDLPDFITFAGSGEPTLYRDIDRVIQGIQSLTTIPVVLLTNGSLLSRPDVRKRVMDVDVLVPSLDAGSDDTFQRVNRPHPNIRYQDLVRGLIETRQEYSGHYLLEVLLVEGFNTDKRELELLVQQINRINPDAVQVNTVFRPPAEETVRPASDAVIEEFVRMVGDRAVPVKYYDRKGTVREIRGELLEQVILKTVGIRPCTRSELQDSLGVSDTAMADAIRRLADRGLLEEKVHGNEQFLSMLERSGKREL